MLSFEDARLRLLSGTPRLSSERVALAQARGRFLTEDVVARTPLPRFDHSAMDGYALATAALGVPPFALSVLGESRAGALPAPLLPGNACRIFTGAPIPPNADTVVMQESVRREGAVLYLDERPKAGQHIRRQGEDLAPGTRALAAGSRVSVGMIALAAMLGERELSVARLPRVTILCTGNELSREDGPTTTAVIPESNSEPLAALARQAGAVVRVAPIVRDDLDAVTQAIEMALEETDVLLTVGGVSVGDHDVVRPALSKAGVTLDFWKVAIKPGKPLAVGSRAHARVLGLPGNPASAIVTFALFGMPLLRKLQGDSAPHALGLPARLAAARGRSLDRLEFARGVLGRRGDALEVRIDANQSSGAATSLATSDGLAFLPAGPDPLEAGAVVDFVRWVDV